MKFACDQCKTKYTIADERVRGKVLKIRCKNCSHIITVREEAATASPTGPKAEAGAGTGPAAAPRTPLQSAMDQALKVPPAAAMHGSDVTLVGTPDALIGGRDIAALRAPAASEQEEWHISVDGVAAGPFRLEALAQRVIVERAAGDQEIFIWRDGFDDWQPPGEVPEVRAAVERLRPGLPRSFWGERGGPPKVEVAEFNEEPPTLAISLKGGQKPAAAPVQVQAQAQAQAPSPMAALFSPAPAPSFKPAASVPGPVSDVVSGPSRKDVLGEVLASLNQQDSAATPPGPPEPAGPPAAGGPDLNIAEPSMVINLATLAARMRTTTSGPHSLPVSTSGAHPLPTGAPSGEMAALPIGAPTSGTGLSQVVVVTGPAPPAPGRHLKLMLSAAILLCVVLLGTVSYLLLNRGQVAQPEDKKDQGKAVTDRPVSVGSDPQATVDKDAGKKGEGGVKKRVPSAAQGKPKSLTSGQDSLAKLYEEQGVGSSTHLPKVPRLGSGDGPGGGGISATGLQDVVRKNQKSIQACYDRVLKRDPTLSRARIDVTVKVGISGTVTHVSISSPYSGTELGSCIQTAIKRWFFPPSDSDYETQFPLLLQAS